MKQEEIETIKLYRELKKEAEKELVFENSPNNLLVDCRCVVRSTALGGVAIAVAFKLNGAPFEQVIDVSDEARRSQITGSNDNYFVPAVANVIAKFVLGQAKT